MRRNVAAFVSAFLFALGLGIGGMTQPAKVVGFLDFAGAWDPSLVLVMGGAVVVYGIGYRLVVRRPAPLLSSFFQLPRARRPDGRLIAGAAIFGVGWGLAGLCPGPALASIATGSFGVVVFVGAMLIGIAIVPLFAPAPTAESSSTLAPENQTIDAPSIS